jgi:hypothetical protein
VAQLNDGYDDDDDDDDKDDYFALQTLHAVSLTFAVTSPRKLHILINFYEFLK